MPKYTTGELAKLCGVTVRTVQYYDTRGILIPSELSEGGRRLYSEDDLRRMKIICFLRELDLPINSISQLLSEENPERVIYLLIRQQEQELREEISGKQAKLDKLIMLKQELKRVDRFSVESIGDIAFIMKSKKKLKEIRSTILMTGISLMILQWILIILWVVTGIWWPFFVLVLMVGPYAILASRYYWKRVTYICPQCHEVFRPVLKEAMWARHTPNTRKLTCTCCGHHGFCVETYGGDEK
ncbi:MerR family transcriptional regulator [Pseudoclostridium thermosuccinogenes]|uniref:MerR family transcriptional regulator n=1 Tax=Clostridium thermosuccinogenes TaxID=84032 RepID=UPI002FDA8033